MKLEADGLATALVEAPPGEPARFAFIMESEEANVRLYYFIDRKDMVEIIESLIQSIGYDA